MDRPKLGQGLRDHNHDFVLHELLLLAALEDGRQPRHDVADLLDPPYQQRENCVRGKAALVLPILQQWVRDALGGLLGGFGIHEYFGKVGLGQGEVSMLVG